MLRAYRGADGWTAEEWAEYDKAVEAAILDGGPLDEVVSETGYTRGYLAELADHYGLTYAAAIAAGT